MNGSASLVLRQRPGVFSGHHRLSVKQLRWVFHELKLFLQSLGAFLRWPRLGALRRVHTVHESRINEGLGVPPAKGYSRTRFSSTRNNTVSPRGIQSISSRRKFGEFCLGIESTNAAHHPTSPTTTAKISRSDHIGPTKRGHVTTVKISRCLSTSAPVPTEKSINTRRLPYR